MGANFFDSLFNQNNKEYVCKTFVGVTETSEGATHWMNEKAKEGYILASTQLTNISLTAKSGLQPCLAIIMEKDLDILEAEGNAFEGAADNFETNFQEYLGKDL